MSGSIRQRGRNSWEIRVYAGTDPETGQRRQLSRTVRGSRTQAQRELRSLAVLANAGPSVGARTTLGELLDRWFAANEADWATTTVRSTWSIIDHQLRPKLGHVRVRDLTTVMIDEFYAALRVDGAVEGDSNARLRSRDTCGVRTPRSRAGVDDVERLCPCHPWSRCPGSSVDQQHCQFWTYRIWGCTSGRAAADTRQGAFWLWALVCITKRDGSVDQADVTEGLRKISKLRSGGRIEFLCEQA